MSSVEKIAVQESIVQDFHASEALKTLRTNLLFCGSNIKAIALTSYSASEGKSTLSFQLAASLAQAGKRVLLLDADLRKSVLVNRLGMRHKVEGLTHYLSGLANASELLCSTDVDDLYIMFAGAKVPNPAELLGSPEFGQLMRALKTSFDYIIVDAAPLGQVIDCAVIAPEMDGVAIVVDSTHNSYKLVRRVQDQLQKSGARILGVILNRVDFSERNSYYGSKYGYGYGEDSPKKSRR